MTDAKKPKHYKRLTELFPDVLSAHETLGKAVKKAGPVDPKTIELIQLAAAASVGSQGSVHSHTRRALQEGATQQEIYHALVLLISTIGFPKVAAAISWAQDILD